MANTNTTRRLNNLKRLAIGYTPMDIPMFHFPARIFDHMEFLELMWLMFTNIGYFGSSWDGSPTESVFAKIGSSLPIGANMDVIISGGAYEAVPAGAYPPVVTKILSHRPKSLETLDPCAFCGPVARVRFNVYSHLLD